MHRGLRVLQSAAWSPSCVVAMLACLPSTRVVCDAPPSEPSSSTAAPSMMPRAALNSLRRRRSDDMSQPRAAAATATAATAAAAAAAAPRASQRLGELTSRDALAQYYNAFADPAVSPAFLSALAALTQLCDGVLASLPHADRHHIEERRSRQIPSGLDSGMYCVRCACEEASLNVQHIEPMRELAPRLHAIATRFETFQLKQSEHISTVIARFLPNDFRASIFSAFKQRSERVNRQAVQELLNNGGTIAQKYDLLWQQQWKRRESLAMIGNATGVWRWLVRVLAGVPDNLLLFAREINAPNGLTEPLRAKFAPALQQLARCAIEMHALSAALRRVHDEHTAQHAAELLQRCVALFETEQHTFVQCLQNVIVNSPFFVQPEEVEAIVRSTDATRDGAEQQQQQRT